MNAAAATRPSTRVRGGSAVSDWPAHFGAMGQTYARRAFTGSALATQGAHELRIVLDALGEGYGRRVLDIGAGTGRFSAALAARGWLVTSLDGADEMLDCIAENVPSATRVKGLLGEPLPFETAGFDAVVAMRVVKYVADTGSALAEMSRVARHGSPVVFDVANWQSLARFGYGNSPMGMVTPRSLRTYARCAGLTVERTHDGFRLPHAVVARAGSAGSGAAVGAVETALGLVAGRNSGRGARSIIVEARREG